MIRSVGDTQVTALAAPSGATGNVPQKPHRTPPPPRRRQKPKFTLEELLTQMPDDDEHSEIDTGPPVGNEVW